LRTRLLSALTVHMDSLITKITRNNTHASQSSGGLDKGNTLNSKKFKITFGCFQISKVLLQIKAEIVEYVFFFRNFEFWYLLLALEKYPTPNVYTRIVIPKQHGCITKKQNEIKYYYFSGHVNLTYRIFLK